MKFHFFYQDEDVEDIPVMGRSEGEQRFSEDLTNVYFENEDDIQLPEDIPADERMDEGFSDEDEEVKELHDGQVEISGKDLKADKYVPISGKVRSTYEDEDALHKSVVNDVYAVLEGEPVNSLYSRVETVHNRQKVPMSNITPQRRPRPNVIRPIITNIQQPLVLSPQHSYNLRYTNPQRIIQYSSSNIMTPSTRFKYQPQTYMSRPLYLSERQLYRKLSTNWNPQASFPSSLSNPRFSKYLNSNTGATQGLSDYHKNPQDKEYNANNLNLNHLMQPHGDAVAPPESFAIATSGPGDLMSGAADAIDGLTPQYVFNLTSHLIRTQQLDLERPVEAFKAREPRSIPPHT